MSVVLSLLKEVVIFGSDSVWAHWCYLDNFGKLFMGHMEMQGMKMEPHVYNRAYYETSRWI